MNTEIENVMTYEENADTNTEEEAIYVEPEEIKVKADFAGLAVVGGVVVAGAIAIWNLTKDKRKAWKEARLAKQGYVKLQPGEMIVRAEVDEDSEDWVETEDEK